MENRRPGVFLREPRDRKPETGLGDPARQERPKQQHEQRGEVAPFCGVLELRILIRGRTVVLPVLHRGLLQLMSRRS